MKNITLSIDEDVLAKVRLIAAEKNTTVNGLVREHLNLIADHNDRAKTARARLIELAEKSTFDPGTDWVWDREASYDGRSVSGHERTSLRGDEPTKRKAKETKSR